MKVFVGRAVLALFMVSAPGVVSAQDVSVIVVSTKGKGGPNLTPQVKKLVEKPLKASVKLVPFTSYKKAAKRAGIKPKDMFRTDSAATIGKEAGVSHILVVEGQMEQTKEGKKKKKSFYADVSLIEAGSGDVVFTSRYALKGKKLSPQIASTLVSEVSQSIAKPAVAEAPPPPAEEVPAAPEAPAGPEAPPEAPAAPTDATLAAAPTETPPEVPPETPAETPPTDTVAALTPPASEDTSLSTTGDLEPAKAKRWRPALHFALGGMALQRKAEMTAADGSPPGYEGPVPGGSVRMSFFPLAIGGDGSFIEGLGLHADSQLFLVKTEVDPETKETFESTVLSANGGLSFRVVFWDSPTAPDFELRGGYGMFVFPLSNAAFPGTRYAGAYGGGQFTIPFMEQLALIVGGHYQFALTTTGKLRLLGDLDQATAFRGEGGVRLTFAPFEILLLGRFEQYTAAFTGVTDPKLSTTVYTDVELTDQLYGGQALVGFVF